MHLRFDLAPVKTSGQGWDVPGSWTGAMAETAEF